MKRLMGGEVTDQRQVAPSWEQFSDRDRLVHLVRTLQFSRDLIERIFCLAEVARTMNASRQGSAHLREALVGKRALLYFTQPSSRTFLSFQAAASILGMVTPEVRDRQTSSEMKGESPLDTVRTYATFHDLIIMRNPDAGFAEQCANHFVEYDIACQVVNAGSGQDDHPTQALLDVYTLYREFRERGGIAGKRILFVGDLARGRTARAFIQLLTLYEDVRIDLVSPKELSLRDDIRTLSENRFAEVREGQNIDLFLPEADAVYMTRVQSEWDDAGDAPNIDTSTYKLSQSRCAKLKSDAVVMHPLPRRDEIPISVDRDPRSRYWDQVENGMWARVGLIVHMLGREEQLRTA